MSTANLTPATSAAAVPGAQAGTATRQRPADTTAVLRIVRLHFADRFQMLAVPVFILATITLLGIVLFIVVTSFTPVSAESFAEGFRYNQAAAWSWPGFIVTLGVYAYARTMPYAIGMMGATRREYWLGTSLWVLVQSAYLSLLIGAFLVLEQLTGHWFTGARTFDVYVLGDGDLGTTLLFSFAIALACLSVGTTLAAVYMRWGQYGVLAGIIALVVVIIGAFIIVLAAGIDFVGFFTTGLMLKVSGLFALIAVVAMTVSWFVVRRVPVGR